MEGVLKFRHNVMSITTISGFENIKGGINSRCKDVYFVRALGTSPAYVNEIKKLDDILTGLMNSGRGYYCRLDVLPKLQDMEDTAYYSEGYLQWVESGKKKAVTRITKGNEILEDMLGNACSAVEGICMQENRQMTDSMRKNLMVKMLFWYDSVFSKEEFVWDEKKSLKIVAANIEKKQEYLFFYLLTLMGCDVLLLQSRGDIGAEEEKLGLSMKFILGDYAEVVLPAYERENYESKRNPSKSSKKDETAEIVQGTSRVVSDKSSQTGQESRIQVKIPPREQRNHHTAGQQEHHAVQQEQHTEQQNHHAKQQEQHTGQQNQHAAQRNHHVAQQDQHTEQNQHVVQQNRGDTTASSGETTPPRLGNPSRAAQPSGSSNSGFAQNENAEKSFEELARLASSVVMIAIHDNKGTVIGTGSGIMVGREGYILTNNHVASGGKYYSVRIEEDDKVYTTDEVIKYNYVLDLAVIRISRKLVPIPIYHGPKKLVRGQKVVAIGSPLGLFNSVSDGIISGFRKIDNVDMIQFTAPTSHGSSGGAVLNMQGEVIGISTAGFDSGQNINLAMGYECINTFIKGFT